MIVPFGFSIGDFITAIEAFKTVCKALKDHEGAATEYQEVSKELDGIRDIVDIVKDLPGNTSTSRGEVTELSQALAARAETCRELVTKFTKRLNRYNPALGTDAPKGYVRGIWSKTEWALFFSPEMRKFRLVIGTHASSITLTFCHLLYLHSLASEESLIKQQQALQRSVQSEFTAVSKKLDLNNGALGSQHTAVLEGLSDLAAKVAVLGNQQLDEHLCKLNTKLDTLLEERQAPDTRSLSTETRSVVCIREQQSPLAMSDKKNAGNHLTEAELHVVLGARARGNRSELHWDSSIVDLMKLLGLKSGLFARGLLAQELDVNVGPRGFASQNIALHSALMRELGQNDGKVPENIYDLVRL